MQLVHAVKAEVVDEIADFKRDDDRLAIRDFAQCAAVEVIEMRVRDEDEIDLRQVVQAEAGMLDTFDDFEPLRPVRIDQDVNALRLDQKRRVADPCNADLVFLELWKERLEMRAEALGEKRGDEDLREEVALVPAFRGLESDFARRGCGAGT